jgi:hypothetical protein
MGMLSEVTPDPADDVASFASHGIFVAEVLIQAISRASNFTR